MSGKMAAVKNRITQYEITETKKVIGQEASAHGVKLKPRDKDTPKIDETTGNKILVPEGMNLLQAAQVLTDTFAENEVERVYTKSYPFYFVNDFLISVDNIIKKSFGGLIISNYNTDGYPVQGQNIQIPIGYDANGVLIERQGFLGSCKAMIWDGAIIDVIPGGHIKIKAKLKFEKRVNAFLKEVEESLKVESVVRGTAVTVKPSYNGLLAVPLVQKKNDRIVLRPQTESLIEDILIPSMKNKRKYSLLFTGDFGTGKTETAVRVGTAGQRLFGRTFFSLPNSDMFTPLIPYLKNYQACTVFTEDIDQIASADRSSAMNDLLNQLDGPELKDVDCTFIFTTNNEDLIQPAMRRPGRIDQVLKFHYCDDAAIEKIFRMFADDCKGANKVDFATTVKACRELSDELQGAIVAEIAIRARDYANNLYKGVISTEIFLNAITSMRDHVEFMKKDQVKKETLKQSLGNIFAAATHDAYQGEGMIEVPNLKNVANLE